MDKVQNLEDVWDNGYVAPASLSGKDIDRFKEDTNATRVVARRWMYQGKNYQSPFFVRLLPDETGLIHYESNDPQSKRLVVLNGDESRGLVIKVTCLVFSSQTRKEPTGIKNKVIAHPSAAGELSAQGPAPLALPLVMYPENPNCNVARGFLVGPWRYSRLVRPLQPDYAVPVDHA